MLKEFIKMNTGKGLMVSGLRSHTENNLISVAEHIVLTLFYRYKKKLNFYK